VRRRAIELIADDEPGVEIAAGGAVVFPLDGDAVVAGAGVAATAGLSVEQGADRSPPAGAERGDPERTKHLLSRVPGEVEQPVDLGDRHLLPSGSDLEDLVAGLDLALFEHAEVEAGAAMGDQQRRNARIVHANAHAVTGHAGLRDLEESGADPVAVADADLVVAQRFHREVLSELPVHEVASPELALPIAIGIDLVDEHGPLLAAVSREIALAVAVHVEPAYAARTADRMLEDAREHGLALPGHLLGHPDVDRQQGAHRTGYATSRISSQAMRASGVVGSKSALVRLSTSPRSAHSCSLEGRPQNQ
jgi:hypothetical protein